MASGVNKRLFHLYAVHKLCYDACMSSLEKRGIALALLAASLYAVNLPFSKILLNYVPATLMAGFLYLGAGLSMAFVSFFRRKGKAREEKKLTKAELPYTVGMIVLDILAPIFLMLGLSSVAAANASLLNNFEIVATAVIALCVFKEAISPRLWAGIALITLSCCILSFEDISSLQFSKGSLLVLLAACCWGLENNCTRKISASDPLEIVLLKGIFSGTGSLIIGLLLGERPGNFWSIPLVLLLGSASYGLSIYFYVYAQRYLGAARTSAYYAVSPFIGTFLSMLVFRTLPDSSFIIALLIMLLGAWLSA